MPQLGDAELNLIVMYELDAPLKTPVSKFVAYESVQYTELLPTCCVDGENAEELLYNSVVPSGKIALINILVLPAPPGDSHQKDTITRNP